MKNPTPRGIAILTAALLAVFLFLLTYALSFLTGQTLHSYLWIGLPVLTFIVAFTLFYFALEQFIYRKIKLIYKTIHRLKTAKDIPIKELSMEEDILGEVNQEVIEWAKHQRAEIESLKQTESYRREFIGNVSHELKTPIFNIQGYIHTLIDGGIEDEEINSYYLKKAAKSIDRLCAIVEDLELITRYESGELTLEYETFDIHQLTQEVFDSLEMRAREHQVNLGFKEGCNHPFFVEADKDKIRQVLVNLISNSIKYGKKEGQTLVGFYDMDENILTEVSDNGIGIPEKHLPRLFERFYRVDKSRSRKAGGTGLGLAIVKHVLEAHEQTINVRSQPEVGTTFGFTLEKSA